MPKICSQCALPQDDMQFRPGHRQCKTCQRVKYLAYHETHREDILAKGRERSQAYREAHPGYQRENYLAHQEERILYARTYYANHPEYYRKYRQDHIDDYRAWYNANIDARRAYGRAWREKHRGQLRTYFRAYMRNYRTAFPVKSRAWKKAHPKQLRAINFAWRQRNRHKTREYSRRHNAMRRARKLSAPRIESIRHLDVAMRDHWVCHICHKRVTKKTWSIDHLIPLVDGGSHTMDNVALAHKDCNARRGARRTIPTQLRLLP